MDFVVDGNIVEPSIVGTGRVVGAIEQCRDEALVRHPMKPTNGGFLYEFEGKTIYSPNCYRPGVRFPSGPPPSQIESLMQGHDYDIRRFLEPQHWTKTHGYLAFTPLKLDFTPSPFNALQRWPQLAYSRKTKQVSPNEATIGEWRILQRKIGRAISSLLILTTVAAVRPAYPCARVDTSQYTGPDASAKLRSDLAAARAWFAIWIGCLAFAIAVHEATFEAAKAMEATRSIGSWQFVLQREAMVTEEVRETGLAGEDEVLDERFVSELPNSPAACFDGSVDRVGTYLVIPDDLVPDATEMVSIDWLCHHNVPVWYAWGPREEDIARRYPEWKRFAPPPNARRVSREVSVPAPVQEPAPYEPTHVENVRVLADDQVTYEDEYDSDESGIALPPPTTEISPESITPAQLKIFGIRKEPSLEERTWIPFFEARKERAAKIISLEDQKARQTRLNRERIPPITSKKVRFFVWDKNEEGVFRRRTADEDDLDDLFGRHSKFWRTQAKYDPVYNEWDLCEFFGVPDLKDVASIARSQVRIRGIKYELALVLLKIKYGHLPPPSHALAQEPATPPVPTSPSTPPPGPKTPPPIFGPSAPPPPPGPKTPPPIAGPSVPLVDKNAMDIDELLSSEEGACQAEYQAYLLYGYTRSLEGQLDPGPVAPAAYVPKALGMHHLDKSVWTSKDKGQPLVKFMLALGKGNPPADFWDLSRVNRMPVASLRRFKSLRHSREMTLVRYVDWDHREGRSSREEEELRSVYWLAVDHGEGWRIGCHSAAHALTMCRLPESHTPTTLAHALVARCIRFQTWVEVPAQSIDRVLHPVISRFIKFRHRRSAFEEQDYRNYIHDRIALFSGPEGRAALMRGGIISKLAQQTVSIDDVLGGPTPKALSGRGILRHNGLGGYLVDDCLSVEEEEAVCGRYDMYDERDNQIIRVYWWPTPDVWDGRFGHVGWNSEADDFFEKREAEIWQKFNPLSKTDWKKRLKISSTFKAVLTAVEKVSQSLIDNRDAGGL